MPLIDSANTLAVYIEDLINTNKGALGLEGVFFGDQNKIPVFPTACIYPGPKTREIEGAPRKTKVLLTIYIMIYVGTLTSTEVNEFDAMKYAELVETLLHQDEDMNNQIVHGLVANIEPGIAIKDASMIRAVRLTFEGQTQKHLPSSIGGTPP